MGAFQTRIPTEQDAFGGGGGLFDVIETLISCFGFPCLQHRHRRRRRSSSTDCPNCQARMHHRNNYSSYHTTKFDNGFTNEDPYVYQKTLRNDIVLSGSMLKSTQYAAQFYNKTTNRIAWPDHLNIRSSISLDGFLMIDSKCWSVWKYGSMYVLGVPVLESGTKTYYYATAVQNTSGKNVIQLAKGLEPIANDFPDTDPRIFRYYMSRRLGAKTTFYSSSCGLYIGVSSDKLVLVSEAFAADMRFNFPASQTLTYYSK